MQIVSFFMRRMCKCLLINVVCLVIFFYFKEIPITPNNKNSDNNKNYKMKTKHESMMIAMCDDVKWYVRVLEFRPIMSMRNAIVCYYLLTFLQASFCTQSKMLLLLLPRKRTLPLTEHRFRVFDF
jgi:hypothetical protein